MSAAQSIHHRLGQPYKILSSATVQVLHPLGTRLPQNILATTVIGVLSLIFRLQQPTLLAELPNIMQLVNSAVRYYINSYCSFHLIACRDATVMPPPPPLPLPEELQRGKRARRQQRAGEDFDVPLWQVLMKRL